MQVNISEISVIFCIARTSIYNWIEKGMSDIRSEPYKESGHHIYNLEDVLVWAEENGCRFPSPKKLKERLRWLKYKRLVRLLRDRFHEGEGGESEVVKVLDFWVNNTSGGKKAFESLSGVDAITKEFFKENV